MLQMLVPVGRVPALEGSSRSVASSPPASDVEADLTVDASRPRGNIPGNKSPTGDEFRSDNGDWGWGNEGEADSDNLQPPAGLIQSVGKLAFLVLWLSVAFYPRIAIVISYRLGLL